MSDRGTAGGGGPCRCARSRLGAQMLKLWIQDSPAASLATLPLILVHVACSWPGALAGSEVVPPAQRRHSGQLPMPALQALDRRSLETTAPL